MKKQFLSLLAGFAMFFPAGAGAAGSYGLPDGIQEGNILHCFDWTFNDIVTALPSIAEAGFGAVQVSPVQGNCATNAEWFYAYMPYDFVFKANGNGSRQQLQTLCTKAAEYGIKIIVDVVANHVNQAAGYHDTWWDSNGRVRWLGGCDYNNRYSITHNQLGEYGDVNSEASDVQARAKTFIEDLKSLGVKGIRWDAAKHIGLPSEGCNFWSVMASVPGLWHYGEILDGPGGDKYKLLKEYTNYIGVTDTEYSKWTRQQVEAGNVPSGSGSWTANGVNGAAVVLWAESHDDYSNDGQYGENTALVSQDKIDRAWAITACRKNETSLYFSRPAETQRVKIKMGQKGSTHFTSKQIAEVNKFRNAMVGTDEYYTASNGVACVTRKGGGAVIVKGSGGGQVSIANGGGYVPAGTYQDRVSGNTFTVTASTITGQVGSSGIAVIYGEVSHEPSVTLSPNGGTFTNTVTVTATAQNATSAWYKIGNGQQVSFSGSATFTLGGDMEAGESVVVSWSATGDEGTKTGSATFRKVEKPAGMTVYLNNTSNWSTPTVWAWVEGGANCCVNDTWPGDKMTKEGNLWVWTAPEGKEPTTIIFSDNGNPQTANLKFVNGATYKCDGSYTINSGPIDDPDPQDMPENLYVLGNIKGAHWNTSAGVEMHKEGNLFAADGVEFESAPGETHCFFNLATKLGSSWNELNAQADRYGADSEGVVIPSESEAVMQKYEKGGAAGNCKSWKVLPGKYRVVADFAANKVKITAGTGLELVIDESGEDIFFTLQGVRIAEPRSGIYIRVRGNKAEKVLVQ